MSLSKECFALLDDTGAGHGKPGSRLYTGFYAALTCMHAAELPHLFDRLQEALRDGRHAVGLFSYELGGEMQDIAPRATSAPLAQVLLFDRCEILSSDDVERWLQSRAGSVAAIADLHASVDEKQFNQAIARIHAYLEAGDTYQVNYTYRLRFDVIGCLFALYRKLRASQPAPYGAFMQLPDGSAILSRSPELFVRHTNGELTAQPMKGTARASAEGGAESLAIDEKNRAENLMIVDLLRNDLGRIAQLGSVRVPRLFEVNRFGNVLQMTSTVQATLREGVSLPEIFSALYPCGSITGAPKRRTMQIIRELEPDARGLYTGGIGWFAAPQASQSVGDFCLSVPIRTVLLQAPVQGARKGELGIGAGIVHDSVAAQEYAECQLKAGFLTGLQQDFELLETMHATSDGVRHIERHMRRLRDSAQYFGFIWNESALRRQIRLTCAKLGAGEHRFRLALAQNGKCSIQTAPLVALQEPVRLLLAPQRMQSDDIFLRHKTTVRAAYDAAWQSAEAQGAFDMLFVNERGEITEGARSNVFVKLQGRWITPPLSAGLLPGVMRSVLLQDPAWSVIERAITLEDLQNAEDIVVCNALRGVLPARLVL